MVYLIKTGNYSDMSIHGYFTKEEDAYQYCELIRKNRLNKPDGMYYDDPYVEAVPEIQVEFPEDRIKLFYKYRVLFILRLDMRTKRTAWECSGIDGKSAISDPTEIKGITGGDRVLFVRSYPALAYVYVVLDNPNDEKALKISQDYFYQTIGQEEC